MLRTKLVLLLTEIFQYRYLSYAPPAYEYGTRPFLRWVLSQGRSPTRQAVPKMPRTPSALRRRAINPTPAKRVKAWGDGPLSPEVMYPVVEHTRTDCAARIHSRSRAPHHRTVPTCLRSTTSFIPPRYRKSRGTSYYTTHIMYTVKKRKRIRHLITGSENIQPRREDEIRHRKMRLANKKKRETIHDGRNRTNKPRKN